MKYKLHRNINERERMNVQVIQPPLLRLGASSDGLIHDAKIHLCLD